MNKNLRLPTHPFPHLSWFVGLMLTLYSPQSISAEPDLSGLWMETNNYPASSVIRFERDGNGWAGKYAQVSAMQKDWGFEVGETVIRGAIENGVFEGQVLLKVSKLTPDKCREGDYWEKVQMGAKVPGKLYGTWRQTHVAKDDRCRVLGYSLQMYGLERLEVK